MSRVWLVLSLPLMALGVAGMAWGTWQVMGPGGEHAEQQAKEMRACVKDPACDYKRLEKQQQYETDPASGGLGAALLGAVAMAAGAMWSLSVVGGMPR